MLTKAYAIDWHMMCFEFGLFFFLFFNVNSILNPKYNMYQLIIHHKHYIHFVITEHFIYSLFVIVIIGNKLCLWHDSPFLS